MLRDNNKKLQKVFHYLWVVFVKAFVGIVGAGMYLKEKWKRLKMKNAIDIWLNECGGYEKYVHIENNNIVLHIGKKCKHTFTFNDIASAGYTFRNDKNIFLILMSKHSSTNKGNSTETYYYNINRNDIEYECIDVSTLLKELENNNITVKRIPDTLELSSRIKNKKTVICPIFMGWHLADKQDEIENDEA